MTADAAIVWAGHGAQLDATVIRFQCRYLLGAVRKQAMLQIDACERRGRLPHVTGGRADKAGRAKKVVIEKENTTIVDGAGSKARSKAASVR
jgi:hypothetical protein